MPELLVEHLSKQYPTRDQPLLVLQDVSFEMSPGDNVAIVGPSGSGKSTLLQIIGTLDRPTSGQVRLNGQNPFALADRELAAFRNQKIGFVFQDHHLLPQLSAIENVLVPTLAKQKPGQDVCKRAVELLERAGAPRCRVVQAGVSGFAASSRASRTTRITSSSMSSAPSIHCR